MIFTKNNLSSRIGLTLDAYGQWRDAKNQDGFRTIALSMTGTSSEPLYTAVMVKYEQPFRGKSWARLDRGELDDTIARMASEESLHPFLIAATGTASDAIYAVAFRELPSKPVVKPNLTLMQYEAEHAVQRAAGRILIAVDAFGSPLDIRFCAIWAANPDRIAWNAESASESGTPRQQRFDALVSVNARESLLAMTPAGGVTRLFVDQWLNHSWSAVPDLSKADMEDLITQESSTKQRFPICIGTTTIDGALRCSAIFAGGDTIVGRVFRVRGPEPAGLDSTDKPQVKKLDAWMEAYVRANNFRGVAMAIVEGTRLVYAKGYTFAEPEPYYQDIEPTTLFRMASVSKAYCAVAVWKALADSPSVSRSSTMQSIIGLKQPDGSKPADTHFGDVTVKHLLESNSGIDQDSVRDIVSDNKTNVLQLQPLTSPQVASQVAARAMPGKPGGTTGGKQATQYGRTDYFLLGLIAAKLAGVTSFESALEKLALTRLKMTRTRGSRTRIEDQKTDDARHHMAALETGTSAVHQDRRIVPQQYGDENYEVYDGAGGLSSAVVDMARLCAMLSCRSHNPLFTDDVLKDFLSAAVAATAAGSDHGYHGFDWAAGTYPNVTCSKGGGDPGVGAGLSGTTGGRFIVIARNGSNVTGATPSNWTTDLDAIAATIDWKGADLFPHFGMPALGA